MRRVVYSVAASLDGYIAGPEGEFDWIPMDPDIDFTAMFARYDTFLMGRRTYELTQSQGEGMTSGPGMSTVVFSRTMKPTEHPSVTIVADNGGDAVRALKEKPGKDIWLFGGGVLFRALLEDGVVDVIEVAIVPVVIGGGIPLLPTPAPLTKLQLTEHKVYPKSGIVLLSYAVLNQ